MKNNPTILLSILLCLVVCWPIARAHEESVIKKVERHSLLHIPWEDEEWPQESFNDYLKRCMRYQRQPQEFKKRRSAFKILAAADTAPQPSTVTDSTTWADLTLFSGKDSQKTCLLENIDRSVTNLGRTTLACMIAQPTTDAQQLMRRQTVVRQLLADPVLFDQIDQILNRIKACENLTLSFWLHDPLEQSAARHYFNIPGLGGMNDMLNRNDVALEVGNIVDHKLRFTHAITSAVAAVVLPVYALTLMSGRQVSPDLENFAQELRRGGTLVALLAMGLSRVKNEEVRAAASRGATLGDGFLYGFSIKSNFEWARDNIVLDMCLQEKLIDVATYMQGLKELAQLMHNCPQLAGNLSRMPDLDDTLYDLPRRSEQIDELLELLATDTFKGEAGLFSRKGRVLAAYRLMHRNKDQFTKALAAVGELDAYVSIAKLYKEFETAPVHYCFVEYKQGEQPSIELTDFWNPLVDPLHVVPNSITLDGSTGRAHVILTGPNAGGKSTVLKSIALSLILAQTIGIAPASYMAVTPLASIATYLNITDDIASGNSLFKAEVLRAQALLEKVEALQPGQFSFVAIDEMFSGTSPEEGRAAAYSVAKHLGKFSNNICMIATHYPLLTKLAKDTQHFTNYKVSVKIGQNRSISYPFKLEPGISDQHVAIDILRAEGFDNQILKDADAMVKKGY